MQKTSSIAIAAALALFAMPAFAQDQNSSTTGQEIVPPAASTTDGTVSGGNTAQTGTDMNSGTAQTTPPAGTDINSGTAQTTPPASTDMNSGTAQTTPSTTPMTDTASTAGSMSAEPFMTSQSADQFLGSNLMGAKVRSAADEDIGDVNDVVFDMKGRAAAVVVGVGGFLGIGEKSVAIPVERLTINRPDANDDDIQVSLETTKDELNAAPEFKKWQPTASASTTEGVTPAPNATGSVTTEPATGTSTGTNQ